MEDKILREIYISLSYFFFDLNKDSSMTATDLVESTALSKELYTEREQLNQMVIALEEAIEAVDNLQERYNENNELLESNERITDDDIQLTNEAIAINCSILGNEDEYKKYRVSTETNVTRYEMLQMSNESLGDLIEKIKEKIVQTFHRVVAFFQRQYLKIVAWINPFEKRLKKLKEKVNNLKENKVSLWLDSHEIKVAINSLSMYSPELDKNYLRNAKNADTLLKNILTSDCDASVIFDRLLNSTKLKQLLENLCEVNVKDGLFTSLEKYISKNDSGCALLTRVKSRYTSYILSKKDGDTIKLEYKKYDAIDVFKGYISISFSKDPVFLINKDNEKDYFADKTSLSKQDLLNFINNLDNKLISKLKDSVKEITKIQKQLVDTVKNKIQKDSSNTTIVKAAIYVGSRASTDSVFWLFDTIKASLRLIEELFSIIDKQIKRDIEEKIKETNNTPNNNTKKNKNILNMFDDTAKDYAKRRFAPIRDEINKSASKADKSLRELRDINKELE